MPKIKLDWIKNFTASEERTFSTITKKFDENLSKLINPNNRYSVKQYFGDNIGLVTSRNKFKKIFEVLQKEEDFQGIYVFYSKEVPFYTGISQGVLKRTLQHVKGTSHFTSSLCYKMGTEWYEEQHKEPHKGGRKGLDFKTYAEPFKSLLKETSIAILPIESAVELYLFECFVAITLKTQYYNKFETH